MSPAPRRRWRRSVTWPPGRRAVAALLLVASAFLVGFGARTASGGDAGPEGSAAAPARSSVVEPATGAAVSLSRVRELPALRRPPVPPPAPPAPIPPPAAVASPEPAVVATPSPTPAPAPAPAPAPPAPEPEPEPAETFDSIG
jgi:outer membrane biosynthesis protein TonB